MFINLKERGSPKSDRGHNPVCFCQGEITIWAGCQSEQVGLELAPVTQDGLFDQAISGSLFHSTDGKPYLNIASFGPIQETDSLFV